MQRTSGSWRVLALAAMLPVGAVPRAAAVTYELTFNATWSSQTHPMASPGLGHFSTPIGGTHDGSVSFWRPGELASLGIERMAELGSTGTLSAEIRDAITAGTARQVLFGSGGFVSPGSQTISFQMEAAHPLVTYVSMIAPSPDWFVGVQGLSLKDADGHWIESLSVPLVPWDAGTDDGLSFTAPDIEPSPHQPIRRLDLLPGSVFAGTPPLGTFQFRLLSTTGLGDFDDDGRYTCADVDALVGTIALGSHLASYDLTGDGLVDQADLNVWRLEAGEFNLGSGRPYPRGDANLDGSVDGSDFGIWNANRFTATASWCRGDFNADGVTDGSDFSIWNANRFASALPATVPEPTLGLSGAILLGASTILRRTQCWNRFLRHTGPRWTP